MLTLADVLSATHGVVRSTGSDVFSGVVTDTRMSCRNGLFIALRGHFHDGHAYLEAAVKQGATGFLVESAAFDHHREWPAITVIEVADTLKAYHAMANFWRRRSHLKHLVGLTGSNGKTTTKEFASVLIGRDKGLLWTEGNLNNHWGVPQTLFRLREDHSVAIIEMGMNHMGEIAQLVSVAEPTVVLCTNVQRAHVGKLGSIEAIAEAKEEIYRFAPQSAVHVYFRDSHWTESMAQRYPAAQKLWFSTQESEADVFLQAKAAFIDSISVEGHIGGVVGSCNVPVFGRHNAANLAAAAVLALAVGVKPEHIWSRLPKCQTAWGRNAWIALKTGRLLFDGYNSNPDSAKALLENIGEIRFGGRTWLVLGEMFELGESTQECHRQLGRQAASLDVEGLWFVGDSAEFFAQGFEEVRGTRDALWLTSAVDDNLARDWASKFKKEDLLVVKGSRGVHLETLIPSFSPLPQENSSAN